MGYESRERGGRASSGWMGVARKLAPFCTILQLWLRGCLYA